MAIVKSNFRKIQRVITWVGFAALTSFSLNAIAGGFQLFEQNVTNLGNAYAGVSAQAADASTEFYNPAGMTLLDNPQVTTSGTYINLNVDSHVSSVVTDVVGGGTSDPRPAQGASNTHPGDNGTVPAFHFVYPFDHKWALGFGVNAPFGLETEYPTAAMARFLATKSSVQTIDLGPSIAYQMTPHFSAGLGIDSQYMSATFNQNVRIFGFEGTFTNEADNWAWGWHGGLLYQLDPCTRFGLAYHSEVRHTLLGNSFLGVNLPFLGKEDIPGQLKANITLPDYIDLSGYHDFNSQWALLGSIEYTRWSTVDVITAHYTGTIADNDGLELPSAALPLNFKNTWRLSTGVNYKPIEKLTLRTGVAFDQSPVKNATTRTFRLPDSDRYWAALGAQYIINKAFTVDVGYSHLFVKNSTINSTQQFNALFLPDLAPTAVALINNGVGTFDSSVNEAGAQLTWTLPNEYV